MSPRAFLHTHQIKHERGFTLVETLVAISIIMVGISATFSVVQFGLSSTIAVKDRITSAFLAQEALEAVRNAKDSNLLAQNTTGGSATNPDWLASIADVGGVTACSTDGTVPCQYNISTSNLPPFTKCAQAVCPKLNIVESTGILTTGAGSAVSRFSRTIRIEELPVLYGANGQREARVTVTIAWPGHTFTVSENITTWFAP